MKTEHVEYIIEYFELESKHIIFTDGRDEPINCRELYVSEWYDHTNNVKRYGIGDKHYWLFVDFDDIKLARTIVKHIKNTEVLFV